MHTSLLPRRFTLVAPFAFACIMLSGVQLQADTILPDPPRV